MLPSSLKIAVVSRNHIYNEMKKAKFIKNGFFVSDIVRVDDFKDSFAIIEKNKGKTLVINEDDYNKDAEVCICHLYKPGEYWMINFVKEVCVNSSVCRNNGVWLLKDKPVDM